MKRDYLEVVRTLQRIAQAGLTYSEGGPYDRERYEHLLKLAAEILASHTGDTEDNAEAILRLEKGYATPKVDVRAVVPKDGKLLFVREAADGCWSFPGGWADVGSTPAEMAAREVLEESGFVVVPKKVLGVLDKSRWDHPTSLWWTYKVFFACELVGGTLTLSHETMDAAFFDEGEAAALPLSLGRTTEREVRRMFEHMKDTGLPADFD